MLIIACVSQRKMLINACASQRKMFIIACVTQRKMFIIACVTQRRILRNNMCAKALVLQQKFSFEYAYCSLKTF